MTSSNKSVVSNLREIIKELQMIMSIYEKALANKRQQKEKENDKNSNRSPEIDKPEPIFVKSEVDIDEKATDEEKVDKVIEPVCKKMRNEKVVSVNVHVNKKYTKDIHIKIDAGKRDNIKIDIINSD